MGGEAAASSARGRAQNFAQRRRQRGGRRRAPGRAQGRALIAPRLCREHRGIVFLVVVLVHLVETALIQCMASHWSHMRGANTVMPWNALRGQTVTRYQMHWELVDSFALPLKSLNGKFAHKSVFRKHGHKRAVGSSVWVSNEEAVGSDFLTCLADALGMMLVVVL